MSLDQLPTYATVSTGSSSTLADQLRALGRCILNAFNVARDYCAAAAIYDEMRGLSDAELKRRGLSRDTLARDICKACDSRPTT